MTSDTGHSWDSHCKETPKNVHLKVSLLRPDNIGIIVLVVQLLLWLNYQGSIFYLNTSIICCHLLINFSGRYRVKPMTSYHFNMIFRRWTFGNWMWALTHGRQPLYHWAISPVLVLIWSWHVKTVLICGEAGDSFIWFLGTMWADQIKPT